MKIQRGIIRYDLGEDFSVETAIVVGELYRHSGEWKFTRSAVRLPRRISKNRTDYGHSEA